MVVIIIMEKYRTGKDPTKQTKKTKWKLKKQNKQKKDTEMKKKIQEKNVNRNRWEVTK